MSEHIVTLDCGCRFQVYEEYPPGPGYHYYLPYSATGDAVSLGYSRHRRHNLKPLVEEAIELEKTTCECEEDKSCAGLNR